MSTMELIKNSNFLFLIIAIHSIRHTLSFTSRSASRNTTEYLRSSAYIVHSVYFFIGRRVVCDCASEHCRSWYRKSSQKIQAGNTVFHICISLWNFEIRCALYSSVADKRAEIQFSKYKFNVSFISPVRDMKRTSDRNFIHHNESKRW